MIKIKNGLDIPIQGEPQQSIENGNQIKSVALIGYDYIGLKPKFEVSVGDQVKLGQVLFHDKKIPGVNYTSPGSGKVLSINRGPKRVLESIIIQLQGDDEITFQSYSESQLGNLSNDDVRKLLLESGLWTSLRTRPFGKVANPELTPNSIFVNAMDTQPHAPDMELIINQNPEHFKNGLKVITTLCPGTTYLCKKINQDIPTISSNKIKVEEFSGPHPSGNVGTHIHFLDPVSRTKFVWYISAQDIIRIGHLFTTGKILVDQIVSLAGPSIKNPRLIKTRLGASIENLLMNETTEELNRTISGSLLCGRPIFPTTAFLGRYHQQISSLQEGGKRSLLGWLSIGLNLFSVKRIVLTSLFPNRKIPFKTDLHGEVRAVYPIGNYETIMPLDIYPTFLLRSLMVNDIEEAEKLGCLELEEEDIALCTFVSPAKLNYGQVLRNILTQIEKEG